VKPENIGPDRVRVRATMPKSAWEEFEALLPRFRHSTPEAIFDLVFAEGLRDVAALADQRDRARAAADRALEGVPPGQVIVGRVD
jgi:hypothetical protein